MDETTPTQTPVDELESAVRDALGAEYRVQRLLGQGGMSVVFLAEELALARRVALKVFPQALAIEKSAADRFQHEARIAASLEHPHIAPIHRFGIAPGFLWYTMKYINGRSLAETLKEVGRLDMYSVLSLTEQAAGALEYAHRHGIVHRDMKPANVMLDGNNWAYVCDFGVAKAQNTKLTQTGGTLGTPAYMSPEQLYGRPLDGRSDQYSLAVVLFELLAGQHPFPAGSVADIVQMHVTAPPPLLSEIRPDLPERLVQGVARAMSKDPADRFDSVITFLTAIGGRRPPQAPQPRLSVPVSDAVTERLDVASPPRRHLPFLAGAGLGVVATVAVVWLTPAGRRLSDGRDAGNGSVPAAAPGHVWINANPWGQVYIDGDSVGRTPLINLTVGAGNHVLRVQRDGYLPVERAFDLTPGQELRIIDIELTRAP